MASYEELVGMLEQQEQGNNRAHVAAGILAGLNRRAPQVQQNTGASELLKGIILAKAKGEMETEQQANDPYIQSQIARNNALAGLNERRSDLMPDPNELARQQQQYNIERDDLKAQQARELLRRKMAQTPQEQAEADANIGILNKKSQMLEQQLQEVQNRNNIPQGLEPTGGRYDQYGRFMPTYGISPERRTESRVQGKASQDYNAYQSDANQALLAIDKIEREAKNLGSFGRGMIPQTLARISTEVGKYSKDQDITRYLGVVSQELIPAARKIMEEKGPITEFDVQRVEKGLGELTTPLEDKLFLLNELRTKVNKALELKRNIAGGEQGNDNFSQMPGSNQDQFQVGETKVKNGITYTYKGNGQWEY